MLSEVAKRLLDGRTYAAIATTNPDGSPQTSVIWARRDGDDVLFSTIMGRRKTRNMERDPRVSLLLVDPVNPYSYAEIRGSVTMTKEGGPELIQELSQLYTGGPFRTDDVDQRLVCRLMPTKVVTR